MRKLPKIVYLKGSQAAFTLLEILIVLSITSTMLAIAVYGVMKFRQVIMVSNTAKELVLQLRQARRYSISNVITSGGLSPEGYYVFIDGDGDYFWGECTLTGCSHDKKVKSEQYTGVRVTSCSGNSVIKFSPVTGEFILTSDVNQSETTPNAVCIIEVGTTGGVLATSKRIEVNAQNRTVKIL